MKKQKAGKESPNQKQKTGTSSRATDHGLRPTGRSGQRSADKNCSPQPEACSPSYPSNPGEALLVYRENFGLKRSTVALALGVTPNHIGNIERGEREPSAKLAEKIWELIGITAKTDEGESAKRAKGAKGETLKPEAQSPKPDSANEKSVKSVKGAKSSKGETPKPEARSQKTDSATNLTNSTNEKSVKRGKGAKGENAKADEIRLKRMARYSNWLLGFSDWAMNVLHAPKTQSQLFMQADELAYRMLFRVLEIRKQALPIIERAKHSSAKDELGYNLNGRLVSLAINLLGCPNLSERLTALANEFMTQIFKEQNTALDEGIDLRG